MVKLNKEVYERMGGLLSEQKFKDIVHELHYEGFSKLDIAKFLYRKVFEALR